MEHVIWVLLLVSMNGTGNVGVYNPLSFVAKEKCEFIRKQASSIVNSNTTSYDAVCVKIVLSPDEKSI